MTVLQAFFWFGDAVRSDSDEDYWEAFCYEIARKTCEDKNLLTILSRYPVLKDKWQEIEDELIDTIQDSLLYFGFYQGYGRIEYIWNEKELADEILKIIGNDLRGLLIRNIL